MVTVVVWQDGDRHTKLFKEDLTSINRNTIMWPGAVEPLRWTNELDRIKDFFEPLDT